MIVIRYNQKIIHTEKAFKLGPWTMV